MKKTSFVLGYAGSVLAIVFSMLMILTVPLGLAKDVLADIDEGEIESEHALAINSIALDMSEQGWTDFSEAGLIGFAEGSAKEHHGDADIYAEAAQYMYELGVKAMVAMIVVAAAIVISVVALIGALIVKKAPTAGGVLLLLSAFFLLLAAIYTDTLTPMFIASAVLALGGIAIFIPAPSKKASAPSGSYRQYAPAPQGGYAPPYGYAPQAAPAPQNGYAPQYAPPQNGYAPQAAPAVPVETCSPLPFPEETGKPGGET